MCSLRTILAALLVHVAAATALAAPPKATLGAAEKRAEEGVVLYRQAKYDEAAAAFLEAYRLSGRATPLRNAAKSLELAGKKDEALARWNELRVRPDATSDDKREAELHVAALAPVAVPEPVVVGKPALASDPSVRREGTVEPLPTWPGWLLLGIAVASAGTAAGLWVAADSKQATLDADLAKKDAHGKLIGTTPETVSSTNSTINAMRGSAYSFFALMGASAIASTAYLIVAYKRTAESPTVGLSFVDGGATLYLGGRF